MFACGRSFHLVNPCRISRVPFGVFVHLLMLSLCPLLPSPAAGIPVSEFFPYGATVGDTQTQRTDDGGSGKINLTVMFPFFGKRHDKLYVNNNGVISFFQELATYTPENFPLKDETPIIAPYWADVYIPLSNGSVWYRETREHAALSKATHEVRASSAYGNFRAYWVFVATWDEVGFYGAQAEGLNKKNTFQAVLVLDVTGKQSFVILNYGKIEWTTGTNSQGNELTGLNGNPAQAGFNAGDKLNFYEIDGARTAAVINLTHVSNVGVPGKWIFRIDSAVIQDLCSRSGSGSVTFQPAFTSMLGGGLVTVVGLCFDMEVVPTVKGHLETRDGVTQDLCCFTEDSSVKCYLPTVLHTGFVNISLSVDSNACNYSVNGCAWNYTGVLEIKNIIDIETKVMRVNPDGWTSGTRVSVTWDSEFFEGASNYTFEILAFMMENGRPHLQSISTQTHMNNGVKSYNIDLPKNFGGAKIAVVRVTPMTNNCSSLSKPAIYSDVFPVRYADKVKSKTICTDWLREQSKHTPLAVTGRCPCTVKQAMGDTAQYSQDPFCSENSASLSNCKYRSRFASQCIIPNKISKEAGTWVCCYDKDKGELLIAFEGHGGGTMERHYLRQEDENVPYFTYMQEEITPYLHCCEFSNNESLCQQYLEIKQPVDCRGYQPPAAAQAAGDPHIVTLDNCPYTFNGIGEYTLLRVKDTQAAVHVKARPATDKINQAQNATVFYAIAMKASNISSLLEIQLGMPGEQDFISVYKDNEPFSFTTAISQLSEMIVYKNDTGNGTVELTVVMEELGLSVLVQATEDLLNIMVMASSSLKGQLEGLLGNYNGDKMDDLTAEDGTILDVNASMRDIHYIFGMSWFISGNKSLFTATATTEFDKNIEEFDPLIQAHSFIPDFIDEFEDSQLPSDTKDICSDNQECWFDYMVTGKKSIAVSTRIFSERYEDIRNNIREVVRCPYLSATAIANGSRTLTGLDVGANITVSCNDGFDVNGSKNLICTEEGEWNSLPPTCMRIVPQDNSLYITIAVGAAVGGFVIVLAVISIIRVIYRKYFHKDFAKSETGSDVENVIELPTIFSISNIPTPVFENNLFMSSLYKLSEKGSFRIPRPTFVDPNIYSEYF